MGPASIGKRRFPTSKWSCHAVVVGCDPHASTMTGVILWGQRELSSMREVGFSACSFCGGKQPIDKKLFFAPPVRALSHGDRGEPTWLLRTDQVW
jgi:hypothetical protein